MALRLPWTRPAAAPIPDPRRSGGWVPQVNHLDPGGVDAPLVDQHPADPSAAGSPGGRRARPRQAHAAANTPDPRGAEAAGPALYPSDQPGRPKRPGQAVRAGSADARALVRRAADLAARAGSVAAGEEAARTRVRSTFRTLHDGMIRRDLDAMPLARLKDTAPERLALSPLERAGFTRVGQVLRVGVDGLRRVPGVGEQTATRAVAAARALGAAIEESLGIRVDLDPGSTAATDLLVALRRAGRIADATAPVGGLSAVRALATELGGTLDAAGPARGRARMLLAGAQRRDVAHVALARLGRIMADADESDVPSGLDAAAAVLGLDTGRDGIWAEFQRRSVEFYGLLGEIVGIQLDIGAAEGRLPADIVARVQEQRLDDTFRKVSLRGYQAFGARFALVQRRVIIGDEMGLGKTIQAIAALAHLRALEHTHFLVVCPASVLVNWLREIARHSDLRTYRLHGPERARAERAWYADGGVAVTTYDTLKTLVMPAGTRVSMLVADEAHYVKNPAAQRSRTLRELTDRAERVLFLTGTPMENRVEEFQHLVGYLQPALLRDAAAAARAAPAGRLPASWFRTVVAPAYLRRNTVDVLSELPELEQTDEWEEFDSPAEHAAYRDAVARRNFMLMRRVAFVADPARSHKLARLVEIAREAAANDRKVVVFSTFHDVLAVVAAALAADKKCGRVVGPITGAVRPEARQAMVDDVGAEPGPAVLLSQIVAGGTGLNIQAASVVILCEPQLKPTLETQAIARSHRMGQVRRVQVHRLLTVDSVDQRLVEILEAKTRDFDAYARPSDLAASSPDALDVSDSALTRQVIEAEHLRMALADAADTEAAAR
jgi:superfamily II DNA or RNA helicase